MVVSGCYIRSLARIEAFIRRLSLLEERPIAAQLQLRRFANEIHGGEGGEGRRVGGVLQAKLRRRHVTPKVP